MLPGPAESFHWFDAHIQHKIRFGFAAAFFLASCASSSLRAPWEKDEPVETAQFVVYAEPGIPRGELDRLIGIGRDKVRLETSFFPERRGQRVKIILFRDAESYRAHRVVPLDSLADFDRQHRRISIAAGSDLYIWRHELSHALLEETAPDAPYWFQEGLALVLQNWESTKPRSCEAPVTLELHPNVVMDIPRIAAREHDPTASFNMQAPRGEMLFRVNASAAFVFFLYNKQVLFQLIEELRRNPRSDPLFPITHGDRREKAVLIAEYERWLQSGKAQQKLPGC